MKSKTLMPKLRIGEIAAKKQPPFFSKIETREGAMIPISKRDALLELVGKPVCIMEKDIGFFIREPGSCGLNTKITYVGEDFVMTEAGFVFSIAHIAKFVIFP